MNGSCGRMGCNVEWYHESLRVIIAGVGSPALVTLLNSRLLTGAGFVHAFPERTAGDTEVDVCLASAGAAQPIAQVRQVHGGEVVEAADATGATGATAREADAIVARAGSRVVAVGVRVADCAPVLLADDRRGDVAAVHVGWRGVTHGIVKAAVDRLGARGSIFAAIGPCIGACCFEVGRDVAELIARAAGTNVVTAEHGDKVFVDLRAAVRAQLVAAGVDRESIEDVPGCTKHETARFHSFRRDGSASGRMLAFVATRRST